MRASLAAPFTCSRSPVRDRVRHAAVLTVAVDAPPWATQLRYLEHDIRARLREISGRDSVHAVRIVVEPPR